jgi:hypothetical protein
MNVQHNALLVDPTTPATLYVGADIGVWRSLDSGGTWAPFAYGLPESPVMDLKYFPANAHPGSPALLRAATYGRSVYEKVLSTAPPFTQSVQLYVRDTLLDRGLYPTVTGLKNPVGDGTVDAHESPDIVLVNAEKGSRSDLGSVINFYQFASLKDATNSLRSVQTARVYVQVHNRGPVPARGVKVMLLLSRDFFSDVPRNPPQLPANFENQVQAGTPIQTTDWRTLAIVTLDEVRAECPRIASALIPKDLLPGVGQYCVLALVSQADDLFTNNQQVVDTLCLGERKAAMKYAFFLPPPP